MPTVIVSHRLRLVAYLVAIIVKMQFAGPDVRVVVVHYFESGQFGDPTPYCGVSLVSRPRFPNWDMLELVFVQRLLHDAIIRLSSVQIRDSPTHVLPDKPAWAQILRLVVLELTSLYIAMFYHPSQIEKTLQKHLEGMASVVFVLLRGERDLGQLGQEIAQLDRCILVFFAHGDIDNRNQNIRGLAMACHSLVEYGPESVSSNLARLPSHVLWLPQFRAQTAMFGDPILQAHFRETPGVLNVDIHPLNWNRHEHDFSARFDLLFAFKAANYVAQTLGNIIPARAAQKL